jgi:hypothetical protein
MRTRAFAALVVLTATLADATAPEVAASSPPTPRFELGVPVEVTLVGLTAGVRPELLVRVGGPSARSRLRAAVGVLIGPEQLFLPFSIGYRSVFRQGLTVQPHVGVGLEVQLRVVTDFPPVRSAGLYLEGGVGFAFAQRWSAGVSLSVDVMVLGSPGFGFGPRAFLAWRF